MKLAEVCSTHRCDVVILAHLLLSGNAFSGDVPVAICRNSNLTLDSDSVKCKLD